MRRRDFLMNGAVALTAAASKPLFAWQGANNRVRMAVIGMGNRSGRVFDSFTRYDDVQFTMGCEVAQNKQQGFQSANRPLAQKLDVVGDYRRVLDRNDIDAVLIGTPDFSHARITADALAAGKHVYVEKPIANNIARINMMLDAYNKYPNLVTQVGTQQRSWDHFIEAKKHMESLGSVTHVLIQHGGGYSQNRQEVAPVPPGLDWDAWQVDAPKKPFKPGYTSFRAWWEYGSGLVGDWGAHHIDVANWFMNADNKQPLKTSAVGFYANQNTDPECVFSVFSIAWQFDTYMMTFANEVFPRPNFEDPKAPDIEGWGVYFYGTNGTLQVNRMGWAVRPPVSQTRNRVPPDPRPGTGNAQAAGAAAPAAGAAAPGAPGAGGGRGGRAGGAPGGGRGGGGQAVEMNVYINPRGGVEEDYPLHAHTRDFLDKLKAKNRKTNAPMEVGYNSALPALLALEAMKDNKVLGWDPAAKKSKVI
jgi:predicted dehydrogenase